MSSLEKTWRSPWKGHNVLYENDALLWFLLRTSYEGVPFKGFLSVAIFRAHELFSSDRDTASAAEAAAATASAAASLETTMGITAAAPAPAASVSEQNISDP